MIHTFDKPATILAIEAGVHGGSLSVHRGEIVLGEFLGDRSVSRADDLLVRIDELITGSVGSKDVITSIAVSAGPGSFTGLRIGMATAMGLSAALGIRYVNVPLFRAMADTTVLDTPMITAIPIGKADICYQRFERSDGRSSETCPPASISLSGFLAEVRATPLAKIIAHSDVIERLNQEEMDGKERRSDVGKNLASLIGRYASSEGAAFVTDPIYVQSPRAF